MKYIATGFLLVIIFLVVWFLIVCFMKGLSTGLTIRCVLGIYIFLKKRKIIDCLKAICIKL